MKPSSGNYQLGLSRWNMRRAKGNQNQTPSRTETGLDASDNIHSSPEGRGRIFSLTSSSIGQLNFSEWPQFCDHSVTSADVRLSVGPNLSRLACQCPVDLANPGAEQWPIRTQLAAPGVFCNRFSQADSSLIGVLRIAECRTRNRCLIARPTLSPVRVHEFAVGTYHRRRSSRPGLSDYI